jgi:accessory gene regulator protein AgrB
MTSKNKSKITMFTGLTSILMLFVIPFFIPNNILNDKVFCVIYFISFLCLVGWSNYTNHKIENMTIDEKREDKIKQILE